MEIKIKEDGEKVFVFSKNEARAKNIFENSLAAGDVTLEDLIKAAVLAHAELQRQKALAWNTVEDLIKETALIEEGVEFEYNSISGEFKVVKDNVLS